MASIPDTKAPVWAGTNLTRLLTEGLKHSLRKFVPRPGASRFRGNFATVERAMAAVRRGQLAGYDHEANAEIAFEEMCRLLPWDYPVLFWLDRLVRNAPNLIDLGGHMGTKYRAFRRFLDLPDRFDWAVYDLPPMVRAGRARAKADGLTGLSFHDTLQGTPASDLVLASGLLQYLDRPFTDLMNGLPQLPRDLVLNKVATCEGPSRVTLEKFPESEVPYQIRNRCEFEDSLAEMGYRIVDQWTIPSFNHTLSRGLLTTSRGYYAALA